MRLSLLLLLPLFLFGIDGDIRLEVAQKQKYLVSEKILLKLHVMSTGFSMIDVRVDTGDNKDFIVLAPQSAAYVLSEELDDETWQSSIYEYAFYPLHGGKLTLHPLKVSFKASQGYGQPVAEFSKITSSQEIEVVSPKGIKSFVLATESLQLDVEYEPQPGEIYKVGDTFSRTVTQKAKSVPDILLSPVKLANIEGLGLYAKEPKLSQDSQNASRSERVDIVMHKAGNYTLPAQSIYWYDSKNDRLHKEEIEAISFKVIEPIKPPKVEEKELPYKTIAFTLILLVLITLVLIKIVRYERTYVCSLPKDINPKK